MKISTLSLSLLMATTLVAAYGCSKRDTDQVSESAATAPAEPQSAPPPGPESAASRAAGAPPSGETTAASESGAQVFETYCVTCHGAEGKGDGPAAAGLDPKPAAFASNGFRLDPNGNGKKGEPEDIMAVVRDGAAKYGGSPLMAPWAMLSPEQLKAVSEHVRSLSGG